MSALSVMIVDDEPLAIRRLEMALERMPDIKYVGAAKGCGEAVSSIRSYSPDVLLLDICMRDGTAVDLLDQLDEETAPVVIFVTAFDQFAIRAFESNIVDYVLKPVEAPRLEAAIERARSRCAIVDASAKLRVLRETVDQLREKIREKEKTNIEEDIWVHCGAAGYVRVPVADIEYVTSEEDYVRLHTRKGSYLARLSIRSLEKKFKPGEFLRVHRRALVRTADIASLQKGSFGKIEVVLKNGARIASGRVYAKRLRGAILNGQQKI